MMKQLTTMMVILAAMTFAVPAMAIDTNLHDGLVSVWSFDEAPGTTTAFDTGLVNSNDAVFSAGMGTTGSDFETTGGILGNYLNFNGELESGSIALMAADSSFDVGDQMTFAAWVKVDLAPSLQEERWIGIFDSQADNYAIYVENDGKLRMKMVTETDSVYRANTDSSPFIQQWAHVAVVYDGRDTFMSRMYVNGAEVTDSAYFGLYGNLQTGQIPSFGGVYNPDAEPGDEIYGNLDGGLDEAGLWSRALKPGEIAHLYNSGAGNAIMASNPLNTESLPPGPLVTVPVGTTPPLIQYNFEGNLTNSGSLSTAADAVHTDGADGILSYEASVLGLGQGLKLDNWNTVEDEKLTFEDNGDRLKVPVNLSNMNAGTMTFWLKTNRDYDHNGVLSADCDANDWEMWIYADPPEEASLYYKYRWRLDTGTVYTNPDTDENGNGGDEWNHYAISWYRDPGADPEDPVAIRMHLNGVLVRATTSDWVTSGDEFYIGGGPADTAGSGNDFGCWSMDDFCLYEGALDNASIAAIARPNIPGDANHDGKVDGSDVTILADNWQAGVPGGSSGVTWEMGDFNGDHMVDGSDVTILADNWQFGVDTVPAAVPEPSTIVLLISALAGLGLFRRRR